MNYRKQFILDEEYKVFAIKNTGKETFKK